MFYYYFWSAHPYWPSPIVLQIIFIIRFLSTVFPPKNSFLFLSSIFLQKCIFRQDLYKSCRNRIRQDLLRFLSNIPLFYIGSKVTLLCKCIITLFTWIYSYHMDCLYIGSKVTLCVNLLSHCSHKYFLITCYLFIWVLRLPFCLNLLSHCSHEYFLITCTVFIWVVR